MAQFRFQYDAVLKQRQAAEDQCQLELARHLRLRHILQDQLARMQQTVRDSKQELGAGLVGQVDVERMREFARYAGQVTVHARQMVHQLAQVEQRIVAARADLAEAMRRRKAMETLRDRQYRQWLEAQRRRETAELDELAVQRYARGAAGSTMESTP